MHVNSPPFVLDHKLQIQMTVRNGIPGIPNVRGALNLKDGLQFLAVEMRNFEKQTQEKYSTEGSVLLEVNSKDSSSLITCVAHWYSVSLLNYLRFIALMKYVNENNLVAHDLLCNPHSGAIIKACNEYSKLLVPNILLWRNKVSAHFAATDLNYKNKDANLNDDFDMLSASLHGIPVWKEKYYFMGSDDQPLHYWSVTKTHEELTDRLWPEFTLPSY